MIAGGEPAATSVRDARPRPDVVTLEAELVEQLPLVSILPPHHRRISRCQPSAGITVRSDRATAPAPSAPTSAKLVISSKINSVRTTAIAPPAVAARARHTTTETRHVAAITRDRRHLVAGSATAMLTGTPANEARPEITARLGRSSSLPGISGLAQQPGQRLAPVIQWPRRS
jgi:hypothetical protein